MTRISILILLLVTALVGGCKPKSDPGITGSQPSATSSQVPMASVEKIVFIDMKEACDCTAKRTEKSWAELEKATEGIDIPVTRIHMDEQDEEADIYADMKPYMAIPAVYFLDGDGKLAGMLQGEITQQQFETMISGGSPGACTAGLDCPEE
jgi:hypothetical protein